MLRARVRPASAPGLRTSFLPRFLCPQNSSIHGRRAPASRKNLPKPSPEYFSNRQFSFPSTSETDKRPRSYSQEEPLPKRTRHHDRRPSLQDLYTTGKGISKNTCPAHARPP